MYIYIYTFTAGPVLAQDPISPSLQCASTGNEPSAGRLPVLARFRETTRFQAQLRGPWGGPNTGGKRLGTAASQVLGPGGNFPTVGPWSWTSAARYALVAGAKGTETRRWGRLS